VPLRFTAQLTTSCEASWLLDREALPFPSLTHSSLALSTKKTNFGGELGSPLLLSLASRRTN
jgi:hypothetical protein